jgi:hypothetical protein
MHSQSPSQDCRVSSGTTEPADYQATGTGHLRISATKKRSFVAILPNLLENWLIYTTILRARHCFAIPIWARLIWRA